MPFSKCLRAKIYSNMNVYFDPQGSQTLLLKESDPLLFSFGSWTRRDFFKICDLNSFMIFHKSTEDLTMRRNVRIDG